MKVKYLVDDREALVAKAIGAGVFYLLKPGKEYENSLLLDFGKSSRLSQYYGDDGLVRAALMPCPGILDGFDLDLSSIATGIKGHFDLVSKVLPTMRGWLKEHLSARTSKVLEIEDFFRLPASLGPYSLVRADLIRDSHGSWRSCDPNAIPLGMAFVQVYAGLLGIQYPLYISNLAGAGKVAIVTSFDYPNWSSHAFLAKLVTQLGGSMVVTPPDLLEKRGVNGKALGLLYKALGWDYSHIPSDWYVPDVVIKYTRESIPAMPALLVNAPGTRLLEAQVFTTLSFIPGIEKFASGVDLSAVRSSVVPGLIMRKASTSGLEVVSSVGLRDGGFFTDWVPLSQNLCLLEELASRVGNTVNRNTSWVVKSVYSSGFKGVRMTNKGGIGKAEFVINQAISFIPDGEIFFVQPRISSELLVDEVVSRTKLDLYMTGVGLVPCAADLMVTSKNQIAVHGGSGTDFWLVDFC